MTTRNSFCPTPYQKKISSVLLTCLSVFCLALPGLLQAQEKQAQEKSGDEPLVLRIQAVSRKAKTVDTATGYSQIIKECDAILADELKDKSHRNYLKKLLGWTLDKRGVSRADLAEQFRKAGSLEQAELVMEQAMADFHRSLENDPERWQTLMHRGTMLAEQEQVANAVDDFSSVIRLNSKESKAWFNRAEMRSQLGEFQAAADDYTQVLKINPDDVQALNGRAHCHLALSQFNDSLADYEAIVDRLPNDAWALANRSEAHLAMQSWKKARSDLQRAIDLQTNGEFCRRLAWLLATCPEESICDGQQALAMARKAIEITGESMPNLDTLAAAHAAAGEFDKARDVYARVIAMADSPDSDVAVKQAAYENNERYQESFDQ